jgi:predicted DsbA family dithiol-disulfide isomerase
VKDPNHPLKLRAKAAGLSMRLDRELIPSTRRAHEGAEFARAHGALDAFHASLLRRYWAEGEDLWQLATLRGAAVDAGLSPDELQRAIEEGTWRPRVEEELAEAHELGISAVPTFLVGDKYVISGAQELLVFEQAMQRLGARPRVVVGNA